MTPGIRASRTIYIVSPIWPTERNPALGTFVRQITLGLNSAGWVTSTVAVGKSERAGMLAKVERYMRVALGSIALAFAPKAPIYLHLPTWFSVFLFPAVVLRGMPLVVNLHGSDIHGRNLVARLAWPMTRLLILRARAVVVPSETFAATVRKEVGEVDMIVSPSGGVDMTRFHPLGVDERRTVVTLAYVSRLVPNKGWSIFVGALKLLADSNNYQGLVVGGGPDFEQLKEVVKLKGLTSRCRILGAVGHDELPGIFRSVDILIFASRIDQTDSLGLVALEAIACGTPVVARDTPLTREYIKPGVNGELCENWSEASFAAAVERTLNWHDRVTREAIAATVARYDHGIVSLQLSNEMERLLTSQNRL